MSSLSYPEDDAQSAWTAAAEERSRTRFSTALGLLIALGVTCLLWLPVILGVQRLA
jgi:hypothetical protein